ncbi:MAG TPA: hypothetical protein VH186_21510 [Chloroflexia bacterium]|nr:hypothetical protein [Chloroflexia bacterium]
MKALILTGPEQSTIRYLENFSFSPGRVVGIAREVMISMLTGNGNPNQRENGCTGPRPGIAKMKGNRDSALVNLYFLKRDHSKILQIPQPG